VGGIVGKLSFDRDVQISRATALRMLAAMGHRGLTTSAHHLAHGMALAWCNGSRTPDPRVAANEARTIFAVSDSELTNAVSLHRMLADLGHRIEHATDADLIAHAYEQWGDACVERLRGPFACAVWDERERRLLLARDRIGIRPLCFALLHGDGVVFASEIKALLQDPSVSREWNADAIDTYLALGYIPAPLTIYRRVSKLEPGHVLVVEGRRLTTTQYWDFSLAEPTVRSEDEAFEIVENALRSAANGAPATSVLTSSGIASTAIAAVLPQGRTAISVGIDQEPSDLLRTSKAAEHLGLQAEMDLATPETREIARLLAWQLDEPAADPAAVAHYSAFVAARRYTDVALAGHGAASLWAGHARHRIERIESEMRAVLGGPLSRLGSQVGAALGDSVKGAHALAHLALPPAGAYATKHAYGLFGDECRHSIYTRRFSWQVREANPFAHHIDHYRRCTVSDPLTRALYVDARTWLPDSRLAIADRAAAAAGLRLHFPFLDDEMVQLAWAMPTHLKLRGASGMYALRQMTARHLPHALLPPARRAAPRRPWLTDALASLVPNVLLHEHFDNRGIFSRTALRRLWEEHRSGERDHAHRLWAVLMLEMWFREFIDGDAATQPAEYAVLVKAA
jgi:asparagine synthase (glutamine-hydrolysing)